jgi:transposase-like protein
MAKSKKKVLDKKMVERVRTLRDGGMTIRAIAALLGKDRRQISRWMAHLTPVDNS